MEVDIATARVDAATGASQSATTRLERVLAEANKLALAAYALEARLALAEVHLRAGNGDAGLQELQRVEDEAAIRGFGVMSRRIAAMRFSTR